MTVARRVVLVLLVVGAGPALSASPAFAGGIDSNGHYEAAVYNLTPYPWTLVASSTPPGGGRCDGSCWNPAPAQTIPPGGNTLYGLNPNFIGGGGITFSDNWGYAGWMTYRVDILGGPPEYVTVALSQRYTNGVFGNNIPALRQFITTAPPPASYDPGPDPNSAPAPLTDSPQLTYTAWKPFDWDLTYSLTGNYTVDASTDLGAPFVQLLNALCSGADNTTCSFDQKTPITYGPGDLGGMRRANNCDLSAAAPGDKPSPGAGDSPPDNDPNYFLIEYAAAQSASLTVGGGITVSAEFNLFNTIASEASVSVEAEHEWEEVKTFTREAKVYIPSNSFGFVWVAPTVGRVTGTLVAKIGSATFTANNFTEVRSGVTGPGDPRTQPIPAFNTVSKTRPMTDAELAFWCGKSTSAARRAAPQAKRSARLVAHRSVGGVALGDTQEAVLRRLGWPEEKRFQLRPCEGMPSCAAVPGMGGTWNYKKRKHSVVFGPDRRVAAIIHTGKLRTKDGVGRDSTTAHLRGKFPRIACQKLDRRIDCTLKRVSAQQTVRTVFRLTHRGGKRWKTRKVLIYTERQAQVNP